MKDFNNKVVAITGGATGIGFALAMSLGAEGAKIIIGEPRQEALDSAIARLAEMGIEAIATPLDVANLASVEAFADVAWKHYGRVDVLINNAGVTGARGSIHRVEVAEARKLFDVNFFGVWHGCAVFSARMIDQGTQAAIYNLGSENSLFVAVPKSVAYVASKHAVFGLSESLRNDLPDFIHVGTIFPGYVDTPLTAQAEGGMNAEYFAEIVKQQIKNGAHVIVSHSHNIVHIDKRHEELTDAYATYAPRYEGDEEYDVATLIASQHKKPNEN